MEYYEFNSSGYINDLLNVKVWASSIAVRALACYAKDPRCETHFELRVGHLQPRVARSFNVHTASKGQILEFLVSI